MGTGIPLLLIRLQDLARAREVLHAQVRGPSVGTSSLCHVVGDVVLRALSFVHRLELVSILVPSEHVYSCDLEVSAARGMGYSSWP